MAPSGVPGQCCSVLGPMADFLVPPDIPFGTQMPPHYNDLFPPSYAIFCLWYNCPIVPAYNAPESIILDSHPLFTCGFPSSFRVRRLMSFPLTPLAMMLDQTRISNPRLQPPTSSF